MTAPTQPSTGRGGEWLGSILGRVLAELPPLPEITTPQAQPTSS